MVRIVAWVLALGLAVAVGVGLADRAEAQVQYPAGRITGSVVDSASGRGIGNAILYLYAETSGAPRMVSYTTSSGDGSFTLAVPAYEGRLYCEASLMGYRSQRIVLQLPYRPLSIRLAETSIVLSEVIVQGAPILGRGDTTTFQVSPFMSANTRSLEDLIKKLPGLSVDKLGKIEWQGEEIAGIQIEDLNLMGSRYRAVSQTLHAEDVSSLEVIERHQPIKAKRGISSGDKTMLNVRLKDKNMLRPSGSIAPTLGVRQGQGLAYGLELSTLLVNAHTQILGAGGINNTHQAIQHEASIREGLRSTPARELLPIGRVNADPREAITSRHLGGTINQLIGLSPETTILYNVGYGDTRREGATELEAQLYDGRDGYIGYTQAQSTTMHERQGYLALRYEHNAPTSYLTNHFHLQADWLSLHHALRRDGTPLEEQGRLHELRLLDRIHLVRRRADNSLWDFNIALKYNTLPRSSLLVPSGPYAYTQHTRGRDAGLETHLSYGWYLGRHINLSTQLLVDARLLEARAHGDASTSSSWARGVRLAPTLAAVLEYQYGRLGWRIVLPIETTIERYRYIDPLVGEQTYAETHVAPGISASAHYRPSAGLRLEGRLSYTRGYTHDITHFLLGSLRTAYDTQTTRTSLIIPYSRGLRGMFGLDYKRPVRGLFARAQLSWSLTESNTISARSVAPSGTESTVQRHVGRQSMLSMQGTVSKRIEPLRTTLSLGLDAQYTDRPLLVGGSLSTLSSASWGLTPRLSINALRWLDLDLSGRYGQSTIEAGTLRQTSRQLALVATATALVDDGLEASITSEISRSYLANHSLPIVSYLDASLSYGAGRYKLDLSLHNLLGVGEHSLVRYLQSDVLTTRTYVRPRQLTLSFTYRY